MCVARKVHSICQSSASPVSYLVYTRSSSIIFFLRALLSSLRAYTCVSKRALLFFSSSASSLFLSSYTSLTPNRSQSVLSPNLVRESHSSLSPGGIARKQARIGSERVQNREAAYFRLACPSMESCDALCVTCFRLVSIAHHLLGQCSTMDLIGHSSST